MNVVRHVVVEADGDGQRVDNYLLKILKKVPKSRIYRMLRTGEVRVDGKRVQPVFRLVVGQTLRIPPVTGMVEGEVVRAPQVLLDALRRRVLFQSEQLLVLDKPAGLAVHGGSGIALGVIEALKSSYPGFLELAHRLDRGTSGVLLLARTPATLKHLQASFREREVRKRYRAVVEGRIEVSALRIDEPLKRYTTTGGERRVKIDSEEGQSALSQVTTLVAGVQASTVQVEIDTGRTHQIRVHLANLGHPVVGDDKYGDATSDLAAKAGRMLLHAEHIEFNLEGVAFSFDAPLPAVFETVQSEAG